jgi:hypothetical protein
MLDARAERSLAEVTEQLRTLCGERLLCVALYGSGVGDEYVEASSDLNLVVVLTHIDRATMIALRAQAKRWRERRVATPLVLEENFLHAAADVFPIELHDIKDAHRLLAGTDVFATLAIRDDNLRYQCEHEARGKLLRLRQLYLEIGDDHERLRELMLDSVKTFLIVMRAAVRMRGGAPRVSYQETLDRFCQDFSVSMPVMAQLLRVKLAKESLPANAEEVFHTYVDEVERLVQAIDQMKVAPTL